MSTIDVPPAPGRPARQRRYPSTIMVLARSMYGDGDAWTPSQIRAYLHDHGHPVSLNTVRLWVVPGAMEEHSQRNSESYARRQQRERTDEPATEPLAVPEPTPPAATPFGRMLQLREAKMTYSGIATILQLDFGLDVNVDRVRYCLRVGRCPTAPYLPRGRPRKHRAAGART